MAQWFKTSFGSYIKVREISGISVYWYESDKIKHVANVKGMSGHYVLSEEDYAKLKKILKIK